MMNILLALVNWSSVGDNETFPIFESRRIAWVGFYLILNVPNSFVFGISEKMTGGRGEEQEVPFDEDSIPLAGSLLLPL
jgi:hypothetical protein